MPGGTLTHLSPEDQQERLSERLLTFSMRLVKPLWGGGILTFIVLHIWQAYDPHRFTNLSDCMGFFGILVVPLFVAIFFWLSSQAIASLVRKGQLDIRGVEVIGMPIPGTQGLRRKGDDLEHVCDVDFQTLDGVHHRIQLEVWVSQYVGVHVQPVLIRYDPCNLSNVVVIPEPRPSWHPLRVLVSYCGRLLGILVLLGCTLFFLALLLLCWY